MELVQWFFTLWVGVQGQLPVDMGPFVNETQCENAVETVMRQIEHPYRPKCTELRFRIEQVRP